MPNEKTPFLSIAVSVFNSASTLGDTLERLAQIKQTGVELIVWDAGSTDDTLEIINKFQQKIDCFIEQSDLGVYDCWNKVSSMAQGEFLWFVNSDDIPTLDSINVIKSLVETKDSDIFHFDMMMISKGGMPLFRKRYNKKRLSHGMNINHPTVISKRNLYDQHKFNLEYKTSADFDWMCRVSQSAKLSYHETIITNMRFGGMSDNPLAVFSIVKQDLKIIKRNYGFWPAVRFFAVVCIIKIGKKLTRSVVNAINPKIENRYYGSK